MSKIKLMLTLCAMFLLSCTLNVKAVQVLDRKVISGQSADCDIHWTDIVFNSSGKVLITMKDTVFTEGDLIKMKIPEEYCCNFLGGFVREEQFYIAFDNVNTIDTYSIKKQIKPGSRIEHIKFEISPSSEKVFTIPNQKYSYYLFGHYEKFPLNPIEYIRTSRGCGEGVYYFKPFLAEVQDDKIIRYIKLPCDENIDESYVVHEAISGESSVHLLGFRNVDVPFIGKSTPVKLVRPYFGGYNLKQYNFDRGDYYGGRNITQSIILHYSDYNLKKEKNTRRYKVYENIPGYNEKTDTYCDYGVLSVDTKDDDVDAVFTWVEWRRHHAGSTMVKYEGLRHKEGFSLNDVNSDIYFWQCSDKSYGKAEKIAEGFCPIVRVDKFGSVHVFWVDRSGNIVHKVKKGNKWNNEEIILNDFSTKKSIIYTKGCSVKVDKNRPEAILYTKFIAAEFDSENNLHVVYPAENGIIYTKLNLE